MHIAAEPRSAAEPERDTAPAVDAAESELPAVAFSGPERATATSPLAIGLQWRSSPGLSRPMTLALFESSGSGFSFRSRLVVLELSRTCLSPSLQERPQLFPSITGSTKRDWSF